MACHQLHPDSDPEHRRICEYMDRRLKMGCGAARGSNAGDGRALKVIALQCRSDGYTYRTKRALNHARAEESKLLVRYQAWLNAQGRNLDQVVYGRLRCDAFERESRNLIEAKASAARESVRMAVGQLLDCKYQGRCKYPEIQLAVLIPSEPSKEIRDWLAAHNIWVIWPSGGAFCDSEPRHRFI